MKLEVVFHEHPLEVSMAEGLGERTRRDDLRHVQIDWEPNAAEALGQSGEEAADGRGGSCAEAVVEEEGADINASRMRDLRGGAGLSNGWVNSHSEEDRTEGVSLLDTPSAVNGLQSNVTRTGVAVTAVDPWRKGRKMHTNGPPQVKTSTKRRDSRTQGTVGVTLYGEEGDVGGG